MFERFTDRARRVVVLAQEEARLLNHNYIGTEHLLLGLICEEEGVAARVLESLDVSLADARAQVEEIIGHGGQSPSGHIPFTPRAKKVLEMALREALKLGHNYIGTEHILLGLIGEGEGVAAQVLQTFGLDLNRIRQAVVQLLAGYPSEPSDELRGQGAQVSFGNVAAFSNEGIRPATCGFCGIPSPECGALFTGVTGALICERCLNSPVTRGAERRGPQFFGRTLGNRVPVEVLAERITPTGPPPDDEDAAREAVSHAFINRMEISADGASLPYVHLGDDLIPARLQIQARFSGFAGRALTFVERVKFVNDHEAVLWWRVEFDGRSALSVMEARAVRVGDTWKITRESVCATFRLAGVECPPEPPSPTDDPAA